MAGDPNHDPCTRPPAPGSPGTPGGAGGPGGALFPSTRWSLVARAGEADATQSREALDELIRLYRPVLLKYLRFVARLSPERAEDVLQGFLTEKVVRNQLIAHADRRRGRFRTFLKATLQNYLRSELRQANAKKRTPDHALPASVLGLDEMSADARSPQSDAFDIEWARTLLQEALERFRCECVTSDHEAWWEVLSSRVINPILHDAEPERYNDLIARLHFSSPSQVAHALAAGKSKLRGHLKDLIAAYARDEEELEEEIHDLFTIMSQASA